MNKMNLIELVKNNYSPVEFVGLDSSDVEILAISLLCEKIWNIDMETSRFFMYYKHLYNEIGVSSYVVFLNEHILYIEIVDNHIICAITENDNIVKRIKYIKESRRNNE